MGAHAVEVGGQQLAFNERWTGDLKNSLRGALQARLRREAPLCAGCREREARYGFRDEAADPTAERPRALCFQCFRMEIERRQAVAAQLARGWNARQATLPLEHTLQELTRRRRRAQIAARHALSV